MNKKVMKLIRACAVMLVLAVCFMQAVPASATGYSATEPTAKTYGYLTPYEAEPGQTIDIKLPVRVSDYTIKAPVISLDLSGTPFELVGDFKLTRDDVKESTNLTMLSAAKVTYVNFQIRVKDSARKGTYDGAEHHGIPMTFTTTDSFNNYITVNLEQPSPFAIKVTKEKMLPLFNIYETTVPEMVKPEDSFGLDFMFTNKGELDATDLEVSLDGITAAGFMPDTFYEPYQVGTVYAGGSEGASFSLRAGLSLGTAVQTVTARFTYKVDNTTYTQDVPIYIQTAGKDEEKDVMLGAVRLTKADFPETVTDGQSFNITLNYKNTAKEDVKDVKVKIEGYDEAGFIPDFYYNISEIGTLKAGKSKAATFKFAASKELSSGNKTLTATVTYTTKSGSTLTDTVKLYMDVNSKAGQSSKNGMPKLLITDYNLGTEKLMAGSEFDFNFTVKNTHSIAKADNIKVTVSSADGTFSIVQGSSSFFIERLEAGESQECSIPLRVKGDVATGGYDVNIEFDYEYAGLDANKNEASLTNKISESLKIPVYSNDRPLVSNINVGYWELPVVGELTTLSFEFYNMGKAPLYNVIASVEGDFDSSGNTLMIGNVQPGSGQSWEMDVIPMTEGFGNGTLHITYEDGNGNESTFDETFGSEINGTSTSMYGGDDFGDFGDFGDMGDMDMPKKGLPLWAKIVIGVGAAAVVAAAVVVVVLKVRKKKKGDLDFDEDD